MNALPSNSQSALVGAHFSTAKGLEHAILQAEELGCGVLQIFSRNARTWKEKMPSQRQVDLFRETRKTAGIQTILSHCTYLINIASNEPEKLEKSRIALASEMERSALLGIDYVVLHPGAHMGQGDEKGLETAARSLSKVLEPLENSFTPRLLIETTAGQGTCLGHTFEQVAWLLDHTGIPDRTGVCLDTSHMFAAGYDLTTRQGYDRTMEQLEKTIGFERVFALHLNDSKVGLASRKDRHEHIGSGCIGEEGFKFIMTDPRFSTLPKILETPKLEDNAFMDPVNLSILRNMIRS
jgi:deoxyribonuclease-4